MDIRRGSDARLGDVVQITRLGHYYHVEGVVRAVYGSGVVSIAISPHKATDYIKTTAHISPDGTYHTIAAPGEFEIIDRIKGVF